jgi:hypothetical protein
MLEDDDLGYDILCDTFNALLDTAQLAEVFVAEHHHESNPEDPLPLEDLEPNREESAWTALPANLTELNEGANKPSESIYEPAPAWKRPAGHAVLGVDAFKISCHVNSLKESTIAAVGDSGAAPTLISRAYLESLQHSKPRLRAGQKLKLIQLKGSAKCSQYVRLNLYFHSQLGPVCLKGVEAYVVDGMGSNLLIGEDTQLAWELHILRMKGKSYWKVGDSTHLIPAAVGSRPKESFTVSWKPEEADTFKSTTPPRTTAASSSRQQWNAVARQDVTLNPESIATITVVSRGAPIVGSAYLEAIALKRGSDSFIRAPHGIVDLAPDGSFQVKIANTTKRRVLLRSGELVGHLFRANNALLSAEDLSATELNRFLTKATQLATLASNLDDKKTTSTPLQGPLTTEDVEPQDTEHLGWGPKTADPGPDQIYPSEKLRDVIDVDPALNPTQREALYKIVEKNQAAFGFDGRLGHLKSKVHIQLHPDTKPISMPPYYASPAKREVIDKQVDLWLSQGVIEESKSPWGAPVIIVYRNGKPRVCIDWRKMNKATIADQYPIPKQTDILQALSGAQYLSVFDALSGFTQMEFDNESRPITAIRTHRGLHHFKRMPFGWRNGPPEFQRAMQEILSQYLWIFTLVYIDDIVVYSKTFDEHLKHVDAVLDAIAKSGLTLSPPKCHLGYRSIIVLGHKVSRLGLSTHHEKLKAVWELEAPKDRKTLESFLGLAVYFSAYIPYFSWMANPLFKNLRNKETRFEWTDDHQKAFELIKVALVSAPVRGHPEAGQAYRLYTDASDYAIAGALQQIQHIAIKDLKGTRVHKRLHEAYLHKKDVPDLVTKLSNAFDDKRPATTWAADWENTEVPVERVVAYWSRVLIPAETRYSATEREALAAKESLVRFQPFIEGERILLVTDHSALTWAKTYENANRRLAAWGLVFAAFPQLVIIHRPGRAHSNVDPLSRLPRIPTFISPAREDLPDASLSTEHEELQQVWQSFIKERELAAEANIAEVRTKKSSKQKDYSTPQTIESPVRLHVHADEDTVKRYVEGYKSDKDFTSLARRVLEESTDAKKYRAYRHSDNGLLYFEDADRKARLCVPLTERIALIKEVHDEAHESAHAGWERTLASLRQRFYWPSMRLDVTEYVRTCDPCQKIKHDRGAGKGYLQPLEIPTAPFNTISLDFVTGLPMSNGKDAILVVVDKLTKFALFLATTTDVTASETATLLFKRLVKLFGLPSTIIGDRDPRWTSDVWKTLSQLFNSRLALSTSKHPQTDGQTEVMNQHLETMLRAYVHADQKDWSNWLDVLQLAYNNAAHSSHKSTPAQLLLGYKPRTPLDLLAEDGLAVTKSNSPLQARVKELIAHRDAARDALQQNADKQAFQFDKGRRSLSLSVGDEVLINPHTLELVDIKGRSRKLMQRKIGPFEIIDVISPTAYKIRLPDTYPMHNVVNIQHLTKYHRSPDVARPTLANPRDKLQSTEEYEVEKIVGEKRKNGRVMYQVRWKGYSAEDDTWQTPRDLRNAPELIKEWILRL